MKKTGVYLVGRAGVPWGAAEPVWPARMAALGRLRTAEAGVAAVGGALTVVPAPRACWRTAARGPRAEPARGSASAVLPVLTHGWRGLPAAVWSQA